MANLPQREINILADAIDAAAGTDRELDGRELEVALRQVREQLPTLSAWADAGNRVNDVAMGIEDAARLAHAHLAPDIDPLAPAFPGGNGAHAANEKREFLNRTAGRIL